MKHTPGPWAATTRQGSWDWLVYQQANPNIEICQPFHDDSEFNEVGEANAKLIAAAPEMLAALKNAIGALEFSRDYHSDLGNAEQAFAQDMLDAATAAIAKAEGGQP